VLLVVRSVGLPVSVCQGAALSGRVGAASSALGFVSAAASCSQKGGAEMLKTRNRYQVEVCGVVRTASRCPSLCHSEGGCFCSDYPGPGVVLNVAELKRRCHRSHRVMAKVNILNQGGELWHGLREKER